MHDFIQPQSDELVETNNALKRRICNITLEEAKAQVEKHLSESQQEQHSSSEDKLPELSLNISRYRDGMGDECIDIEIGDIEIYTTKTKNGLVLVYQESDKTVYRGTIPPVKNA